jgi:hypothetical protein
MVCLVKWRLLGFGTWLSAVVFWFRLIFVCLGDAFVYRKASAALQVCPFPYISRLISLVV